MPLGLLGDEQADPSVHGGLDKAVYAYPTEHYPFWIEERTKHASLGFSSDLAWGAMGENLSVQGLLESQIWLGDLLQFEHCTLRVTQPREPCFKFNAAMGFNTAVKRMAETGFCGFYLAVDIPGQLRSRRIFLCYRRASPGYCARKHSGQNVQTLALTNGAKAEAPRFFFGLSGRYCIFVILP